MELVPLGVAIGLKKGTRGGIVHAYPDFNKLDKPLRQAMDWSAFVDQFGGWHYDDVAGHADDDPENDSPRGTWLGMLLVPEDFANAAVAMFPDQCRIMDATDAERFYEDRVTINQPSEREDVQALQGLLARVQLEKELGLQPSQLASSERVAALNPESKVPGIRKNELKTWGGLCQKRGITIKGRKS